MPTYLPEYLHIGENAGLITVVAVMAIIAVIVTFLGSLSDRIGRKPVMYAGSVMLVVISVPMFLLLFHGSMPTLGLPVRPRDAAIFFGTLPQGLILVCFMSTEPSTLPTLFPTNVRAGATAVAFNISVSAFGGTTPLIAAALVEGTGNLMMPAYILIVAGVVGIVSVAFTPEPVGTALRGSGPTVENEEQARYLADYFRGRHKRRRTQKLESR
jgi:MHS family proline/betaine transporter-like MFS transporter